MIYFLTFYFGTFLGSFLNVCIHRIPIKESIVYPGSRCPICKTPLRFYDNIPVISYLILLGKCRHCKSSIPFRYPVIEILTGLVSLCTYLKYDLTIGFAIYFLFLSILIIISFIDIDHQLIPDKLSIPGIFFFFSAALFLKEIDWHEATLGVLSGGGILYLIGVFYKKITGTDGMGGGDIKLLAMIGSLLGWKGVIFTIFSSSVIGSAVGIILMVFHGRNMKVAIPYGPFLSIGAFIYVFFGNTIINWYLVNIL